MILPLGHVIGGTNEYVIMSEVKIHNGACFDIQREASAWPSG